MGTKRRGMIPGTGAAGKDIWRTIRHGWKRFLALLVITALGVTMATGLKAACVDLRRSADAFFDAQNLHDIAVVSTLGLTDADLSAMGGVEGVHRAVGGYSEQVSIEMDGATSKADVSSLDGSGMNMPYVIDGRLPVDDSEVAVTAPYLRDSGAGIGDTVTFGDTVGSRDGDDGAEEGSGEVFSRHGYTIVGTVIDPMDVNNDEGGTAFRTNPSDADYAFFVTASAVDDSARDTYTVAYLTVDGARDKQAYTDGYDTSVDAVKTRITDIRAGRERARTNEVKADMNAEIDKEERAADRKLTESRTKLDRARSELDGQWAQLQAGIMRFEQASGGVTVEQAAANGMSAAVQLQSSRNRLDAARDTLDKRYGELDKAEKDAQRRISDARDKVDDIADAQWYIRDRTAMGGYASIDSDAGSIESIGTAFPVLFLLVAVLIGLTAIARMVEEERLLIGTYKALGYRRGEILLKYVVYAGFACLLGGVLGDLLGFIALPKIIFTIFSTMYLLPVFTLHFDWPYGIGAVVLFTAVVVGAAAAACRGELRLAPAALMRPKAPKAGKTILLERIRPLWRRMSFLDKVTARNLFRYKTRALMTIAGIAGCTMLLMCGFAIRDSVVALSPAQYGGVTAYDLMAVTSDDDNPAAFKSLRNDAGVKDAIAVRIDSATLGTDVPDDGEEGVQLVVIPDGTSIADYIHLREAQSDWSAAMGGGAAVRLDGSGVVVTKNAQQMLGIAVGDPVTIRDSTLHDATATVDAVVENYLGNTVFMTRSLYERLYGDYHANAMLAHLEGDATERIRFCDELAKDGRYLSVTSTDALVRDFSGNFRLINTVVYVLLVLAGALAFVVLFTLSTTNISERERELATIKVLGFRRREVRHYVNKEMLILTVIGVAVGLPLGRLAGEGLTMVLRMPGIYFAVHVHWLSYVISGALALAFAAMVMLVTNRMLDRIDMVGALKSPE